MKSDEKRFLFNQKIREGKDEDVADYEIERDEFFIKKTNEEYKELKKDNKKLKRENEKLNRKLAKAIVPVETPIKMKNNKKIEEIKNYNCEIATIRDLNRIIALIEDEGRVGLNDLTKTCQLRPRVCKSALNFLIRYGFIRQINGERKVLFERV